LDENYNYNDHKQNIVTTLNSSAATTDIGDRGPAPAHRHRRGARRDTQQ
jgi:hypothetical protein